MQVILLEQIQGVGKLGDVVNVARGYGRNFLLPRQKALLANKENMAKFEAERAEREAKMEQDKSAAAEISSSLVNITVSLKRQASETGMLYGSVKARDIAAELQAQNIQVQTSMVMIGTPIKEVGEHTVKVALHPEVIVDLPVAVERQSTTA